MIHMLHAIFFSTIRAPHNWFQFQNMGSFCLSKSSVCRCCLLYITWHPAWHFPALWSLLAFDIWPKRGTGVQSICWSNIMCFIDRRLGKFCCLVYFTYAKSYQLHANVSCLLCFVCLSIGHVSLCPGILNCYWGFQMSECQWSDTEQ